MIKVDREWKTHRRVILHTTKFHEVSIARFELPNGNFIEDHLQISHPNWINMIVVDGADEKIAMIEQYRPGLGLTTYELPGGIVHGSSRIGTDSKIATVVEELEQELGRELGDSSFPELILVSSPNPSTHSNQCFTYLIRDSKLLLKGPSPEATEDLKLRWFELTQLMNMIGDCSIVSALSIAAIYRYASLRNVF